jgi:hypothetical protein
VEPSGALSLFDALSKQFGLKLEMQKRPLPVLVIDQVVSLLFYGGALMLLPKIIHRRWPRETTGQYPEC